MIKIYINNYLNILLEMNKLYAHKVGFTYEYFVLDQIKKDFDKVWHWKDFPEKLMYENNLIKDYDIFTKYRYDIGADLVAVKDNKYYFIQCKNYSDTILMENLAGFYFLLYEYNLTGILYYNGKLSQRVFDLSTNKIKFINMPFNNSTIDIIENIEKPLIVRDYQLEAYKKLLFKNSCILSLPCGMGKTYTTYLMAKHYNNIIILSPLRYLAFQTLEQYKKYLGSEYSPILISLDGKRKLEDINNYIKDKNIISLTYDSVDILIQIIDSLKNIYLIVDEFHNLSDNNINDTTSNMYKILNYSPPKVGYKCDKIFVSATPLKDFMGIDEIYNYNWKDAIANKYICDFTIYIPDTNENYNLFVNLIKQTCNNNLNDKIIKKAYFMLKSLLFNGDRKCICYMTKIEYATEMYNILIWMSKLLGVEIEYWQIDCNTKKTIRQNIIENFKKSTKVSILINVHILDEGINIIECDSVFISNPSKNIINIIQRMCRANRICENKFNCNIYLWCKEKKTDIILNYINDNTHDFIKNKVFIYNTENKIIDKYVIDNNKVQIFVNCNIFNKNILLKNKLIKYIKNNNLSIDINFINIFFKKIKIGGELDFDIKDKYVAEYLGITLDNVRRRLQNKYSKTKKFIEKVDFIKQKLEKTSSIMYLLNYQCFEKLAMNSETSQAEIVRSYFVKLREFIVENQHLIYQAIENKQNLSIYRGYETIYFFAIDNRKQNIFKVGRTQDILQRLRNYNVGRIKEVELKYFALVKNPLLIEKCIKLKLEKNLYFKDREIYKVDPNKLKKIIDECYCKFVSRQQNEELYKEISDLLGLYAYTKNKINIKPYVIIR